jgi:hypothetical protein
MKAPDTSERTLARRIAMLATSVLVALGLMVSTAVGPTAVVAGAAATTAAHPTLIDGLLRTLGLGDWLRSINNLRSGLGLGGLTESGELDRIAQAWTEQMAAAGTISHNPNLGSQVSGGWTLLGENVGVGYDVLGLMTAFINSPHHYENLVDPAFNLVGIGEVVLPDGRMFTTHVFEAKAAAPAPKPAPAPTPTTPAAPKAPKAQPAATTTTVAPAPEPTPTPEVVAPPPPPVPHPTPARVAAVLTPLRTLEQQP